MTTTLDRKPVLGIVGLYQQGKSTLVNCLLDDPYAPTGEGLATTKGLTFFRYGEAEEVVVKRAETPGEKTPLERREDILDPETMGKLALSDHDQIEIRCWKPLLEAIDLLDTPGFNADERDDRVALRGVDLSDMLLVVLAGKTLCAAEERLLDGIVVRNKPFCILVNCRERVDAHADPESAQVKDICHEIKGQLAARGWTPIRIGEDQAVWPCNLLWAWHAEGHLRREADDRDERRSADARQKIKCIERHFELNRDRALPTPRALMGYSQFLPIREMLKKCGFSKLANARMREAHALLEGLEQTWSSELNRAMRRGSHAD